MRLSRGKKKTARPGKDGELERSRAIAPTLEAVCPNARLVRVQLDFICENLPHHAQQAYLLHPPAKAHFAYPCPFGDCTGIFHLEESIGRMLTDTTTTDAGSLTCIGLRARQGVPGQPCEQVMDYTVAVQYAQPVPVARRATRASAAR
ncbi:MAG: hypothetical protein ABIQ86_13025 [Steroidobacteraceae bacterium]